MARINNDQLDNIAQSKVTNLTTDLAAKATNADLTAHTSNTSNPHSVSKSQVGLSNVDNTSDADKPISTATQTALDGKAATTHAHVATDITDFDTEVANNSAVAANTAKRSYPSADEAKLAGIEANATADQTAAEIKTAYESNTNTNAFTNSEKTKLSNIETNADVTDTTNVTAAGALMDFEVANLAQVKAFNSADYATAAQGALADSATQPGDNVSTLTNDAKYTSQDYISSRELNLVTNWSGLFGDNYNFSSFTYDGVRAPLGIPASFSHTGKYVTKTTDEYMSISPDTVYELSLQMMNVGQAVERQYVGLVFYDIDKYSITALTTMYVEVNAASLSRDYTVGDSKVYFDADPGWDLSSTHSWRRGMICWNHQNSKGYTYPPFTYSRNVFFNVFPQSSVATFNGTDWEIPANTTGITSYGATTIPAGTRVSRSNSGGTYKYITAANVVPAQDVWTKYSGTIGGVDTTGTNVNNNFPAGAAFCRVLFLANYASTSSTNQCNYAGIYFAKKDNAKLVEQPGGAGSYYDIEENYFDGNITVTGTVDGRDLATDGSKLDGVESGADVTDTANVTAAGALMDSEVTNLAAVKAFNPADYATAAEGALAATAIQPGDNVSTLSNDAGYLTSAPVGSVNSQTGAVVLDADDIDDAATLHKFVTAADITKLGNLSGTNTGDQDLSPYETSSQLDARDTANRARSNHTGVQAISTVTGLQTALDSKLTETLSTWSPTFTGLTLGNGTVNYADFTRVGDWVEFELQITLGSTSVVGTGLSFTAPVTPDAKYTASSLLKCGEATLVSGSTSFRASAIVFDGGIKILAETANLKWGSGTTLSDTDITASYPFTWATGNVIFARGRYRA